MCLLIVLVLGSSMAVYGDPFESAAPAANFWKEALPGSPLPKAIAVAIDRGAHMTPLVSSKSWSPNCYGSYKGPGCGDGDLAGCFGAYFGAYEDDDQGCSSQVATTGLFFNEEDIHLRNVVTLSSPPGPEMAILPRKIADGIPFGNFSSNSNLTDFVLQKFHIVPGSPAAADVKNTLQKCMEPTVGDHKQACATSLEGVVQVAMHMLGTRNLKAMASALPSDGLPRQAYFIQAVSPLSGSLFVACHRQPYPYVIYYCHSTGLSKAYKMSIRSQAGSATIDMVAVCHKETSEWNPNHPAFKALRTQPGGSPVCHYIPYGDLIFGKEEASN